MMHTPSGHGNHFWVSIGNAIKTQMKGCPWQAWLLAIDDEVSTEKRAVEAKMKLAVGVALINSLPRAMWSAPFSLFFVRPSAQKKTQPQPEDLALITRWWSGGIGDGRFRSQLISIKSHPLCAQLPMLY